MTLTSEVLNRHLPKWPQMIVVGKTITVEQALEIIRRTDMFFTHGYGGNDHGFDNRAKMIVGMPETDLWREPSYNEWSDELRTKLWQERWDGLQAWREKWQVIETEYVHNSWISCSFVGGPHGWCHPDGKIFYQDNVGKWPSIEAIRKDWSILAKAFPFLDLRVLLMDRESCEDNREPVVGFRVKSGRVRVLPGEASMFKDMPNAVAGRDLMEEMSAVFTLEPSQREHRLGLNQIKTWKNQVYGPLK